MSDTESEGSSSDPYSSRPPATSRLTGACIGCKALKHRCEWIIDEGICMKCKTTGADCVPRGRKKRRPAMSHEQLRKRSLAQDAHIQSLLSQLDGLKRQSGIRNFVDEAQAEATTMRATPNGLTVYLDEDPTGGSRCEPGGGEAIPSCEPSAAKARATASFFLPYYSVIDFETFKCPPILKCGLFGPAEVTALFKLYFDKLHVMVFSAFNHLHELTAYPQPSFALLDPVLHTPEYVLSRSSLLFTTVLYIAARLWTHRPKLFNLAWAHVAESVKAAVTEGSRTIETCQAFTLMCLFPAPQQRYWNDSRGRMLMGVATRIAQDLKLDDPPPADLPEREKLNRLRTWFQIVSVDAAHAIQKGQATMIQRNNFTAQMMDIWYKCSPLNSPYDVYCSAYADLMLFVSNLWGPMGHTSMNSQEDDEVIETVLGYHRSVCNQIEVWKNRIAEHQRDASVAAHRDPKLAFLGHALRLTVLGVGFQHSVKRMLHPNMELLSLAIDAARHVLKLDIEHIYPTGTLRYVIEPHHMYVTYSAAFLINLLRPCLAPLLQSSVRVDILREVRSLIELFNSRDVAVDRAHLAAVYAAFLEALLDQMTAGEGLADDPAAHPSTPTQSNVSRMPAAASANHGSSSHVIDIETSQGAEFTFDRFVVDITTHQESAYPAPPAATWHGFPVDEGTW
ncbi:uncharacterized protein B0H18DRAFT_1115534 [Fomitopsis serialis]|uniref:uncharacterized protein n=1 Tax=Fomitopsis serialis TaxID=139415 RepID=UPI0020073326|nr:uncharacterized protein B0H18DRAFT_1115534 [Neoantrodia serialis]KAH9932879.1 hypothetical protein B0H18DRAFT_1115534 [Neoantrodia serialis]